MTEETFNFIIARYWFGSNRLNVYMFHNSQVQNGTNKDAKYLLARAIHQSGSNNWEDNPWKIVKIDFK